MVGYAHEDVEALHGIPVKRKSVLIVIAIPFFHQETALNSPSVSSSQVAPFMKITAGKRFTRYPGVFTVLVLNGTALPNFIPLLFTDDHMKSLLFLIVIISIVVQKSFFLPQRRRDAEDKDR